MITFLTVGPRLLFIPGMVITPDILSNKTMIFISPDDILIGQVEKSLSRGKGKVFQYSGERLEPARQPWVRFSLYHYFLTSFRSFAVKQIQHSCMYKLKLSVSPVRTTCISTCIDVLNPVDYYKVSP